MHWAQHIKPPKIYKPPVKYRNAQGTETVDNGLMARTIRSITIKPRTLNRSDPPISTKFYPPPRRIFRGEGGGGTAGFMAREGGPLTHSQNFYKNF